MQAFQASCAGYGQIYRHVNQNNTSESCIFLKLAPEMKSSYLLYKIKRIERIFSEKIEQRQLTSIMLTNLTSASDLV